MPPVYPQMILPCTPYLSPIVEERTDSPQPFTMLTNLYGETPQHSAEESMLTTPKMCANAVSPDLLPHLHCPPSMLAPMGDLVAVMISGTQDPMIESRHQLVTVRNMNNDMRPTFRLSVAGRWLSSPGQFMLGVVGGIHDHQCSWVTLTRAAGIIGTETNNSLEFLPPAKPCAFRSLSCLSGDAIVARQSRCSQAGGSAAVTNPGALGPFNDMSPQSCSNLSVGLLSTQFVLKRD